MRRAFSTSLFILAASGTLVLGCEDTIEPAPPQVVVAITTDLRVGTEIDFVRLLVSGTGSAIFEGDIGLSEGEQRLPATLTVVTGTDPAETALVRAIGSYRGVEKVRREFTFAPPTTGTKLLRVPLEYLCVGSPACPSGQTCVGGKCESSAIDVTKLEDYSEEKIKGGATKQCFDVDSCFQSGVYLHPAVKLGERIGSCIVDVSTMGAGASVDSLNIGLLHLTGDKTGCPDTGCVTPLYPTSGTGWSLSGNSLTLPDAVCTKVTSGEVAIVANALCQKLSVEIPTCSNVFLGASPITPSNPPAQKGFVGTP